MRIHCSLKIGLAMGVMLVSGGCAGDLVGTSTPQPPRPMLLPVLMAVAPAEDEVIVDREVTTVCRLRVVPVDLPVTLVGGNVLSSDKVDAIDRERIEPVDNRKGSAATYRATLVRKRRP